MLYFTLDKRNNIGHPTVKGRLITKKLKNNSAKIISRTKDTMVIQFLDILFDESKTINCEFRLGLDPGSKYIGFALLKIDPIRLTIKTLLKGTANIRSIDVPKNLAERSMYRKFRRYCRRKNVLRKYGSRKFRKPIWKNRKLAPFRPTHIHLAHNHYNLINWINNRVLIDKIHIEYNSFDTHRMVNPNVRGIFYQKGPLYNHANVTEYVRKRENYTCQICEQKCLTNNHAHHITTRKNRGSNHHSNFMLLCEKCHEKAHKNPNYCNLNKYPPNKLKTELGILNSIMKRIFEDISEYFSTQETYGYITKLYRRTNNIEKSHSNDAEIIAMSDCYETIEFKNYTFKKYNHELIVRQYRRHKRAWVSIHEDRKYYYNGKTVAWNRNKKINSKKKKQNNSLTDYRKKFKNHELNVKPGRKVYFRPNSERKFKPGDIVLYDEKIYDVCKGWASTQGKVELENYGKVPIKKCKIIRNNSGLIYI